ncbi:MAG: HupE/UreJ family protein [Eudoraea sp.]|nr:HupE/UreJ family protein [Eudoraea sp.]
MAEFWFYLKLGYKHVMDPNAIDHILFLCALVIPFTYRGWRKVLLLATIFTVAHCISLGLSAYGVVKLDVQLIEFLIPITIILTASFNVLTERSIQYLSGFYPHVLVTAFFGGIHGFGFSNYFNILVAQEEDKMVPLLGFAGGIEISQLLILLVMLMITSTLVYFLKFKPYYIVIFGSIGVATITIPLLLKSFPW